MFRFQCLNHSRGPDSRTRSRRVLKLEACESRVLDDCQSAHGLRRGRAFRHRLPPPRQHLEHRPGAVRQRQPGRLDRDQQKRFRPRQPARHGGHSPAIMTIPLWPGLPTGPLNPTEGLPLPYLPPRLLQKFRPVRSIGTENRLTDSSLAIETIRGSRSYYEDETYWDCRRTGTAPPTGRRIDGPGRVPHRHRPHPGRLPHLALPLAAERLAGLFACHDVSDLPRTSNDPGQFFGARCDHDAAPQLPRTECVI